MRMLFSLIMFLSEYHMITEKKLNFFRRAEYDANMLTLYSLLKIISRYFNSQIFVVIETSDWHFTRSNTSNECIIMNLKNSTYRKMYHTIRNFSRWQPWFYHIFNFTPIAFLEFSQGHKFRKTVSEFFVSQISRS